LRRHSLGKFVAVFLEKKGNFFFRKTWSFR
jgi:hypothetical protein